MKLTRWLVTFCYAAFIFYLSSRTWQSPELELFPHQDKVMHAVLYTGLAGLCVWALRATTLKGRAVLPFLAASMAFIYGVTDELHQSFIPGRDPSAGDLAANAIGAIIGAYIAIRLAVKYRSHSPSFVRRG